MQLIVAGLLLPRLITLLPALAFFSPKAASVLKPQGAPLSRLFCFASELQGPRLATQGCFCLSRLDGKMSRKRQATISDFFAAPKGAPTGAGAPTPLTGAPAGAPEGALLKRRRGAGSCDPKRGKAEEIVLDSSDGENNNPTVTNAAAAAEDEGQQQKQQQPQQQQENRELKLQQKPPVAVAAASVAAAAPAAAAAAASIPKAVSGGSLISPSGEMLQLEVAETKWREALGSGWYEALKGELSKPYMRSCLARVAEERRKNPGAIFPPEHLMFNAFKATPLETVKVVIVGQDPYHQPGQAMGLCFSVARGISPPPSLVNIFKEIQANFPSSGVSLPLPHGDLSSWASQGVLLLNSLLSVKRDCPMAHKDFGWSLFTDEVLSVINKQLTGVVFLLWGRPAQKKSAGISRKKHFVLEAGHPSPLSVRFFSGCRHFAKCNEILQQSGKDPIDFTLNPKP